MMTQFTSVVGDSDRRTRRSLWRFVLLALLLCTWLGNAQQSTRAQHQAAALSVFAPVVVEHCPGLSPYDAAALLQEPINAGEAISNLIFGPLHAALDAQAVGLQGFCGYTNATPVVAETIDRSQPHLLTNVPYPHAVAVAYFTPGELHLSHTGKLPPAWYDLLALTDVAGATNPAYDHQRMVQELSAAGAVPPFITWLNIATQVPYTGTEPFQAHNFTASAVPVIKDETDDPLVVEPYEALLWIWQPLTDGYFSVLVAKGYENQYQMVVARLGRQANEQDALGYSRVILKQLYKGAAQQAKEAIQMPTSLDCEQFNINTVEAVLGDSVVSEATTSDESVGCSFNSTKTDSNMRPIKLMMSILSASASQRLLQWLPPGDPVDQQRGYDLDDLIFSPDYAQALALMAATDWQNSNFRAEILIDVSDHTLLSYYTPQQREISFNLLHPRSTGGLYHIRGISSLALVDLRTVLADLINQMIAAEDATAVAAEVSANPTDQNDTNNPSADPPPTPVRAEGDTVAVVLDQPFILTLGQTAEIADLDFRLTFRSATDNSGCASANDCSTMIFDGSFTMQKGAEDDFAQAMAFIPEGAAFSFDFAGYMIYLTRIEKVVKGDFAATLFITAAPEPTPTATATPSPTAPPTPTATPQPTVTRQPSPTSTPQPTQSTGCPFLSTDEAATILGMAVKAQEGNMRAQENLRCAYRSVDGTTAVLLATYGPYHPQRLLLDWVTIAAPNEDRRLRQAEIALQSGDPHQYLAAVQVIAKKLDNWSVVQTTDDAMTLYAFRQRTVGGQQIYWAALHPTNLIAVEMLITVPPTADEDALYDSLRQHSARVFVETIAAYQAAWPLVRDRLTSGDAAPSAP